MTNEKKDRASEIGNGSIETETESSIGLQQPDQRLRLIISAWIGTAIAGGIFGVLLFCWELVLPTNFTEVFSSTASAIDGICKFLLGCIAGFVIGVFWAGFIGLWVSFLALPLIMGLGLTKAPVWLASFFGGCTAFIYCGGFAWVAVVLGQVGATWAAAVMVATKESTGCQVTNERESQFGLGQLFRFMTLACVGLGVFVMLPLEERIQVQVGYCLAWQCAIVLLVVVAKKLWVRRST